MRSLLSPALKWMPLLALLAVVTGISHLNLDRSSYPRVAQPAERLLPVDVVKWLAQGYRSLVADYYWLRLLEHYGDDHAADQGYPQFLPLLERVNALDPQFATPYFFAGMVLPNMVDGIQMSVAVLESGARLCPDDWRIHFTLGFNRMFYLKDYDGAARSFARAALDPQCPSHIAPLAMRLSGESNKPLIGIQLIDVLLDQSDLAEPMRREYIHKRKSLVLELQLLQLSRAVSYYREQTGRLPPDIETLLDSTATFELPRIDPFGGSFWLDKSGKVGTTSNIERLKLSDKARRLN